MTTTLPGMPPATPAPTRPEPVAPQWTLQSLQVVNWGGFEGHHEIDFSVDATLLTGATGTGKSTLLDAIIALMMESNVPFNGASNDNVSGRARSGEQRNALSYVRGKIDTSRDENNDRQDETLRGRGQSTWSAVAATWINTDGTQFTALRLYYAPATITSSRDLKTHMATYPGRFSLAWAEPFAQNTPPFHHSRMASAHPGLAFYDAYASFARELHKRLGIGRNGDGASALRLLARIQAGRQVASVDGLFRDMVLEEPRTYSSANEAIEHFTHLEASHQQMLTAEDQVKTLRPITDAHADLQRALHEERLIDTVQVGAAYDAPTPWRLWTLKTQYQMLDTEISTVRRNLDKARSDRDTHQGIAATLAAELAENIHAQAANGGDALDRLDADLETLRQRREETGRARDAFLAAASPLDLDADSPSGFADAQQAAHDFVRDYEQRRTDLRTRGIELGTALHLASENLNTLKARRDYLRARTNLVPERLDTARAHIARELRIDPENLPFVAELVDLDPAHDAWREAAELVMGGFARTLLVDRTTARDFRSRVNALRLRHRINFQFVDTGRQRVDIDPPTLAGRLVFKDTPFTGWLTQHLYKTFDHECVPDPSGFRDDRRRRVTLTGQVQDGDRGAHGGHGAERILGFSNLDARAQVERDLLAADAAVARAQDAVGCVALEERALDKTHAAHQAVLAAQWRHIDVFTAQDDLDTKIAEKESLLAASDTLATLRRIADDLQTRHIAAIRDGSIAAQDTEDLDKRWGDLTEEQDRVSDEVTDLEHRDVPLTADQRRRLDNEYANADVTGGLYSSFTAVIEKVRTNLNTQATAARREAASHRTTLTTAFEAFQARWQRPNLGVDVESYPEYQAILDDLNEQGLAERRDRFTAKVVDWSGEDLLRLQQAYYDAQDEIRQRLEPVNAVLASLPFGPNKDRLQLTLTVQEDQTLLKFRKDLRTLASHVTVTIDPSEIDAKFEDLRRFIARIRPAQPGASEKSQRDHLLDVRRHVHIEARKVDAVTGTPHGPIYDAIGGKSGGESQELIAFIVGAALRYRLGDETLPRPAYAPVFLDEGFVKADSEFAGRAVDAWRGLGFQLIIGAPLDKVTAIEPYMDQGVLVTKDETHRSTPRRITLKHRPRPVPTMTP